MKKSLFTLAFVSLASWAMAQYPGTNLITKGDFKNITSLATDLDNQLFRIASLTDTTTQASYPEATATDIVKDEWYKKSLATGALICKVKENVQLADGTYGNAIQLKQSSGKNNQDHNCLTSYLTLTQNKTYIFSFDFKPTEDIAQYDGLFYVYAKALTADNKLGQTGIGTAIAADGFSKVENGWYHFSRRFSSTGFETENIYISISVNGSSDPENPDTGFLYDYMISNVSLVSEEEISNDINNDLANANTTSIDLRSVEASVTLNAPTNPNCIVYANKNYGLTKNVVVNGVCANLELTDKKPFNAKEPFTATNAKYTREAYTDGGWESIMLPFAVKTLPEDFVFDKFTSARGESAVFEEVTSLSANTPYLMKSKEKGEGTTNLEITASSVTISPATDTETFKGVYQTISGENKYLLNGEGTKFGIGDTDSKVEPFHGYLELSPSPAKLSIVHRAVTGINTQTQTTCKVWGMSQAIMVNTPQPIQLAIRNLAGQLIKTVSLTEGTHQIDNLAAGIYLVGNQKVAIYE